MINVCDTKITNQYLGQVISHDCTLGSILAKVSLLAFPIIISLSLLIDFFSNWCNCVEKAVPYQAEPLIANNNKPFNQNAIDNITRKCIDGLMAQDESAIRDWAVKIYSAHGYNLTADRGGHMKDVFAQEQADALLNPVLLREIDKLIPYSDKATFLKEQAIERNKPLSELVFQ